MKEFNVWDRVRTTTDSIIRSSMNYTNKPIWYEFTISEINKQWDSLRYRENVWVPKWVLWSDLELVEEKIIAKKTEFKIWDTVRLRKDVKNFVYWQARVSYEEIWKVIRIFSDSLSIAFPSCGGWHWLDSEIELVWTEQKPDEATGWIETFIIKQIKKMNVLRQTIRGNFYKSEEQKIAKLVEGIEEQLQPVQEMQNYLSKFTEQIKTTIRLIEIAIEQQDKDGVKKLRAMLEKVKVELNDKLFEQMLTIGNKIMSRE